MSKARPIILLVALLALALTVGVFAVLSSVRFMRAVVVDHAIVWGHFLEAEFLFLFGWRFLQYTVFPVAVLLGRRTMNDEPQIKQGAGIRLALTIAAGGVAIFFPISGFLLGLLFAVPGWYGQIGYPIAAVLMFCAFTYPWRRKVEPCAGGNAAPPRAST